MLNLVQFHTVLVTLPFDNVYYQEMSILIQVILIRRVLICYDVGLCGYQIVLLRTFRNMIVMGLKICNFIT